MTTKNIKIILFASLIAVMVIPLSGIDQAVAEKQTNENNFVSMILADNPKSSLVVAELSFPENQTALSIEIAYLLELADNNPEMRNMVDTAINNLRPLMEENRISLATDKPINEIQPDYHKSLYDYQVTAWVEYPCQNGWLVCKSLTNNNNIDRGTTFSTQVAIEKNPDGEDLQFHHKIKNTSGYSKTITSIHFGSFKDMDKRTTEGCNPPLVKTLNYRNNQSHDIRYCVLDGIEQGDRANLSMYIR